MCLRAQPRRCLEGSRRQGKFIRIRTARQGIGGATKQLKRRQTRPPCLAVGVGGSVGGEVVPWCVTRATHCWRGGTDGGFHFSFHFLKPRHGLRLVCTRKRVQKNSIAYSPGVSWPFRQVRRCGCPLVLCSGCFFSSRFASSSVHDPIQAMNTEILLWRCDGSVAAWCIGDGGQVKCHLRVPRCLRCVPCPCEGFPLAVLSKIRV